MTGLPVPHTGFVLGAVTGSATKGGVLHGLQAMRISFADQTVLEEVLKYGSDLKISFGKSMRLDYGDQSMEIVPQGESHRHELYKRADGLSENLNFVGVFSHNLDVREGDGPTFDESERKLQSAYGLLNEEKAASTTSILDMGELPHPRGARRNGPLRKAPYLKKQQNKKILSAPSSGPTTPMMRSGRSPLSQSSAPTSTSAEVRAELKALQIPVMHLLALGNASEHSLASKTRASEDLVLKVLVKIARRVNAGRQWALDDESYKDLDVWGFPYISATDREKAIGNCREAFNKLRLEKRAPEWRILLSPEDREKADGNPEPAPEPAKFAGARSSVKSASESGSGRSPLSSVEAKKPVKESAKGTKATAKTSKQDPLSRIINPKGKKKTPAPVKPRGPIGRPPKNHAAPGKVARPTPAKQAAASTNSRIKSAEIIVDSDEDVEMEEVKLLPPKQSINKSASPQQRPLLNNSASPQKHPLINKSASPQQRPLLNKSASPQQRHKLPAKPPSTVSNFDADRTIRLNPNSKRTPNSTASRSPAKKLRLSGSSSITSNSSAQPLSNGYAKAPSNFKLPSRETLSQRSSSNSPPKPSPLGSSPPINASDVDAGSTSSSPSFMTSNASTSTASQSPLDSLSGRGDQKPRYIPSVASSLKRKAGSALDRDNSPQNGFRPPTSAGNGVSSNKRQLVSPPDGQTMKLARRFKEDYSRYERLYKEAEAMTDVLKRNEAVEKVIALHRELERLKLKISNLH